MSSGSDSGGTDGKRQRGREGNASLLHDIRKLIKGSEERTIERFDKKIDLLSENLTKRLDSTEKDVKRLGRNVKEVKSDLMTLTARMDKEKGDLPDIIERVVSGMSQARVPRDSATSSPADKKTTSYFAARNSLRIWPLLDLSDDVVRDFLTSKLQISAARAEEIGFKTKRLPSTRAGDPAYQALVTFEDSRQRDEVKAAARNLSDREVGVQMEPPDHLRSHYQTFQALAYHLKLKNPLLKRNVKFCDSDLSLEMDFTTGDGNWRTVGITDAREALKQAKSRTSKTTRKDLADLLGGSKHADISDDSSIEDETMVEVSDSDDADDAQYKDAQTCPSLARLSLFTANARSLLPKLESLFDCMSERNAHFGIITETWVKDGKQLTDLTDDLRNAYSLGIIARNRGPNANNGRAYGGVAFVYRLSLSSFKQFACPNPDDYEILATVGKVKGIKPKIFCLSCYAPPNMGSLRASGMVVYISDLVAEAKRKLGDVLVVVSGDFNQWPLRDLLDEHPDLAEVDHGPTRLGRSIDRTFVNFPRAVTVSGTSTPLETEEGNQSDHRVAHLLASFEVQPTKKVTYTYRALTPEGADKFASGLELLDWELVYQEPTAEGKASAFQKMIDALMDQCFQWRTTTRREDEEPWVDDFLKRLWKRRRKVYDRDGRSPLWRTLSRKASRRYAKRMTKFLELQRKNLTGGEASRRFFKLVKSYSCREKPPDFDVRTLYPEDSDEAVAEKLAEHFNAISSEFDGLDRAGIPLGNDNVPLPNLTQDQVATRLRIFKKPRGVVRGDIFPALVTKHSGALSAPLTHIFNAISEPGQWPNQWKTEYVTPIPKVPIPQSPNDLRNISCTMLISKVYESFVLNWLGAQTGLRENQFGGVKGSGSEHLLVRMWQDILQALEDPRAAVLLTSIDFAKAFNRLDFNHCLRTLRDKGASNGALRVVASFLSDRTMMVKVGSSFSQPRRVLGGVPQGSILGVFLFNCSIDSFETEAEGVRRYEGGSGTNTTAPGGPSPLPVPDEPTAPDYRHLPPFLRIPIEIYKYVDDNVILEKLNFVTVLSDGRFVRDKWAVRTQNTFESIIHQAVAQGMKINASKTKALLISELKSYAPTAHFFDVDGNPVRAGDGMKILGVHFSSDPGMAAQVADIKRKFTSRIWALRHLGRLGMSKPDLLAVYKSTILPMHDYCSTVYNSSLTLTQSGQLERLQAMALKAIYGFDHSYRSLLSISGLSSLKARRDERGDRFASRCLANPRFASWFPAHNPTRVTRRPLPYQEERARTVRLHSSPIYHLRRRLNGKED